MEETGRGLMCENQKGGGQTRYNKGRNVDGMRVGRQEGRSQGMNLQASGGRKDDEVA
jgi:hypothetical protein